MHDAAKPFVPRHLEAGKVVGVGADCYADRFTGEGVQCSLEDNDRPEDDTTFFDTTEADLRKCLSDYRHETKPSTTSLGDRAFSFSKGTTRIQGCRGSSPLTDEATDAPTGKYQAYMRLEVFTEP